MEQPNIPEGELKTKSGLELITNERQRQIQVEGWTPEHDASHKNGEMAAAAGCYIASALSGLLEEKKFTNQSPLAKFQVYDSLRQAGWKDGWPWVKKWYKPSSKDWIKDLIKAGALIAAEIDRLQSIK